MFVYLLNKDDFYKVATFLIKQTSKLTIFVLLYNARHFINHTLLPLPIYSTSLLNTYFLKISRGWECCSTVDHLSSVLRFWVGSPAAK